MRLRLILSFLVIVGLALLAFTIPVGLNLGALLRDGQRDVALREARTIAVLLATATEADEATATGARLALVQLREALEEQTDGRVELIGVDRSPALGRTVANADDGDFDAALAGGERARTLEDSVLGASGLQVTVPAVTDEGAVDGAVRLTLPTAPVDAQIRDIWAFRAGLGAVVLVLSVVASVLVAKSLLRPLRLLDAMAGRMSRGDFTARVNLDEVGPPETRRLGETLNDGARRIGVLLSAQKAFTADASHQLRTPLTSLRLSLDNLQDRLESPTDKAAVDDALREAGRLGRLVSDLLVLARSQAPTRSPEPVDLDEVIERRARFWAAAAEDAGVRIERSTAVRGVRVLSTPGHLEQTLDNLIDNALRVSGPDGVVALRVSSSSDAIVIDVIDRGPGLTADDRERAFDRFWSTSPDGSGLGLAIARQLTEHDGGSVELAETAGGGLTARVELRRVVAGPPGAGASTSRVDPGR